MAKTLHRQGRSPAAASFFSTSSARAMTPCAPIGAIGKGSFSTSLVIRKNAYPKSMMLNWPTMNWNTIRAIGTSQSEWRKLRWL